MTLTSDHHIPTEARVSSVPRPEYPRPDRDRSTRWLTLNGEWGFSADGVDTAIVVPFAWETAASGVGLTWLESARYTRTVTVPAEWGSQRVALCFGAVHHRATVRIDGRAVGVHTGGYDSFEFDITDHITVGVEAVLQVDVEAPADKRGIPHGKQRSIPRDDYDGVSFTPSSGIWQSVWIEARGRTYAEKVAVRGDSLMGFDIDIQLAGDHPAAHEITLEVLGTTPSVLTTDEHGRVRGRIELDDPRLWSPRDPYLYELRLTTGGGPDADFVTVTSGLRRFEARGEELYLNGERYYMRGVLDQGYWPETGLTAPDAASLLDDIRLARELGYTLVRKHLKFEEPIWLHEADRTGMLVWAEPACPSRFSPAAAREFEDQLAPMVERDGNHPSIVIWGLYNEEWGLDWDIPGSEQRSAAAVRAYELLASLDRTRPIVENSGWSHVRTDLVDWHYYEPDLGTWRDAVAAMARGEREDFPVRLGPDFVVDKSLYAHEDVPRAGLPLLNSEYGEGFTSLERAWHLRWETQELRRHDRFAGYVYTEFADVEHEAAGLLDAHRRPKDWGGCVPSDVNADTVLVLDLVPLRAGADIEPPEHGLDLRLQISHHGQRVLRGTVRAAWQRPGGAVDAHLEPEVVSASVTAEPFTLSDEVVIKVPARGAPGRLVLWLEDEHGAPCARTFVDAAEVEPPNRRGARAGEFEGAPAPGMP